MCPIRADICRLAVSEVIVEVDLAKVGLFKSCNLVNFTRGNAGELHNYTCSTGGTDHTAVGTVNVGTFFHGQVQ